MRIGRLLIQITLFYVVVTGTVLLIDALFPQFENFLPIGGAEGLLAGDGDPFDSVTVGATKVGNLVDSLAYMFIAILGALLTVLPVSWIYIAVRDHHDFDQSLVETIILLPVIVTSIVILVHNSLALAFSLAGIVAGVQFRNSLKSSGDTLFVLLCIGIGLGAGIGALEVSLVMSFMFNYVLLTLWFLDYGWMEGARRYLRDFHHHDDPAAASDPQAAPVPAPAPAPIDEPARAKTKAKKRK